jgi:hypothetical protein
MRKLRNELISQIDDLGKEFYRSHAPNALGDDRTLCGMALEGMGRKCDSGKDWHSFALKTTDQINCPQCLQIIAFCRSKLLDFVVYPKTDIESKYGKEIKTRR